MNKYPNICSQADEETVSPWLDFIKRQECAIIVFPPKGDAHRRVEHLINWTTILRKYLGKDYRSHRFAVDAMYPIIDASIDAILVRLLELLEVRNNTSPLTVQTFVSQLKPILNKNTSITFFLLDTDLWFRHLNKKILITLSQIAEKEPRIQFLLFCETDITSSDVLRLNLGTTTLIQNYQIVPLYSRCTIYDLIGEFGRYWQVTIEDSIRQKILNKVGCHTWLVKEAVRLYIKEKKVRDEYVTSPTIRFRLEAIWQEFSQIEQSVFLKIAISNEHFNSNENNSLKFVKDLGFVKNTDGKHRISVPVLEEFIKEKQLNRTMHLSGHNEVELEGENISGRFGGHEKSALICLLKNQGKLVKRGDLGRCVWGDGDEAFSDWTLDRLMSRLRKKIKQLGVDPAKLQTVKKAGWIWKV